MHTVSLFTILARISTYVGHRLEVQDNSVAMMTGVGSSQDLLVEEQWI